MAAIALILWAAALMATAQTPRWQREIEDDRAKAARGESTSIAIPPGAKVRANWPPGLYVFSITALVPSVTPT
jgi:hypothetical protein